MTDLVRAWVRTGRLCVWSVLIALPVLMSAAGSLEGQGAAGQVAQGQAAVSGRILDSVNQQAVPGALVEVSDDAGRSLGVATADEEGRFVVPLSRAGGPLLVRAGAMFYRLGSVGDVIVRSGETFAVADILLEPDPAMLASIAGVAERSRITRGSEWVRQRQMAGGGAFFAGSVIAIGQRGSLGAYLASETGLWPRMGVRGGVRSLHNPRGFYHCMVPMVNQWPMSRTGYRSLDDIPVDAIAAVEIYDNYREVPSMLQSQAGNCGVINVWTWNSW